MRVYEENVIQISGRITINVNVRIKTMIYGENTIFGIFLHVVVKMENIQKVLWIIQRLCMMKLQSHDKETKKIPANFDKKKTICKRQDLLKFY